jgi:transposase-like protein
MAHQAPRRQYDKQFKIDTVELTLKGDKTTKEVADDLGISAYVLYRWRSKYLAKKESAFPGTGNPKDSEAEKLRKLEHELRIVTEEREILKKALAVFSR